MTTMMKKFLDFVFSMQFALTLMMVMAVSVAIATFVENDFGTLAAKSLVYSATWFEILLFVLTVSMVGNILRFKLIQRKKYNVLIFHIAFAVIMIGAGITRFFGFEGMMQIREGTTSNTLLSDQTYIQIQISDGINTVTEEKSVLLSGYGRDKFSKSFSFAGKNGKVTLKEYMPNAAHALVEDPNGIPYLSVVTVIDGERLTSYVASGERESANGINFTFNTLIPDSTGFNIRITDKQLTFNASGPVYATNMGSGSVDTLAAGTSYALEIRKLYTFNGINFVIRNYLEKGNLQLVSAPDDSRHSLQNAAVVDLTWDGVSREMVLLGGKGYLGEPVTESIKGTEFTLQYGARLFELPFSLHLRDFQLERYPGSMSPSSFASEVTLIDPRKGIEEPRRIYMNNVLNYGGYRFYQSSYDKDELGTILSVNHDYWGTFVTYLGYLFMALGLVLNLFFKSSRFQYLIRESNRIRDEKKKMTLAVVIGFMLVAPPAFAQHDTSFHRMRVTPAAIDKEHAASFGSLHIQDRSGRIEPINTFSSEVLRKVSRKNQLLGMSADQVLLGMLSDPVTWQGVKMIKVSDALLKDVLGVTGNMASFNDFIDFTNGEYKIGGYVDEAYSKKPALRTAFDKDIIKVDERVNICYMIFTGSMLKIFPKPGDENNTWYPADEAEMHFDTADLNFVKNVLPLYYSSINQAITSGDWTEPNENLGFIKLFQNKFGAQVIPPESKTNLEIRYNNINIFKRIYPIYGLLGFVMLFLIFAIMLSKGGSTNLVIRIIAGLIAVTFTLHTLGLAVRWYISGHAPWSNGYETMIYIAWATMLSGLIFARRSKITLAITAILASLTLMVANLAWLDPEITNLVPVLKSYWLIIHVAVITASYSFLAIGALLGFLVLVLLNIKNGKNAARFRLTLEELTNINEINLTIGVILISIGTFMGAVWANESWGRYWGWDPKETWALITMLIYSFIIHMRMIPGLRGNFAFNFAALTGFSSVLMTYFGVNYYLSGLHSYASGDPVPVPTFVYYTVAIIAVVSLFAYLNDRKMDNKVNNN
jgi:cytochrome c-type biogenesis protein CcsB